MAGKIDQKVEELHRILEGDSAEKVAITILFALSDLSKEHSRLLSFKSISNLARVDMASPDLLRSISILTSPSINVLAPIFVLFASDGDEYVLSRKEIADARKNGYLIDPHSGEKIKNFDEVTFPYFSSTEEFQNILGSSNG